MTMTRLQPFWLKQQCEVERLPKQNCTAHNLQTNVSTVHIIRLLASLTLDLPLDLETASCLITVFCLLYCWLACLEC